MQSLTIPMLKKGTALFSAPAKSAPKIPAITWPPFMTYFLNSTTAWAAKFFAGNQTMPQYFQLLQNNMVNLCEAAGLPGQHLDGYVTAGSLHSPSRPGAG